MREARSAEDRCKAQALRIYIARAKARGLAFRLFEDEFFSTIDEPCHYCGAVKSRHTTVVSGRWRYTYRHNGVDRIDDTFCYTWDNCAPCCVRCNRSKGKLEEDEWLDWVMRIADRIRERSGRKST